MTCGTIADLLALVLLGLFLALLLWGIPLSPIGPAPSARTFGDGAFHPTAGPLAASVPPNREVTAAGEGAIKSIVTAHCHSYWPHA